MTTPKVRTCLMFDGKAEEAARFYVSLLPGSAIEAVSRPHGEDALAVEFTLAGVPYLALNAPVQSEDDSTTFQDTLVSDGPSPEAAFAETEEFGFRHGIREQCPRKKGEQ